jgi:hypothetical protein
MIRKGTLVRVRTTNGGDGTFVLADHYRCTYYLAIVTGIGCALITPGRIVSVEPILWGDPVC